MQKRLFTRCLVKINISFQRPSCAIPTRLSTEVILSLNIKINFIQSTSCGKSQTPDKISGNCKIYTVLVISGFRFLTPNFCLLGSFFPHYSQSNSLSLHWNPCKERTQPFALVLTKIN